MSRRTARVAEAIREVVSTTILFGLNDPRIRGVTVTRVEVSGDLRNAKIFVSLMGDDKEQSLCMHGLKSARGFLQRKIADRLNTRYTPVVEIVLDEGVKESLALSRLLREVLPDPSPGEDPDCTSKAESTDSADHPSGSAADE